MSRKVYVVCDYDDIKEIELSDSQIISDVEDGYITTAFQIVDGRVKYAHIDYMEDSKGVVEWSFVEKEGC